MQVKNTKKESTDVTKDTPRGIHRRPYDLKVGDDIHGFSLNAIHNITDFNITAFALEHSVTKAKYLHLDSPDLENVFTVRFKTPPENSKGVPHILEHMSL